MTGKLILISFICLYPLQVVLGAIAQAPLFLTQDVPPIVLLTMGRNHKLYNEAYNDTSDLDKDGALDIRYKPDVIDYYGYFDSYKCYSYTSGVFIPQAVTNTDPAYPRNKSCENVSGDWSGDFLNYMTTARMDALRKVLYGGYRSTDSETTSDQGVTILERVYVPRDSHGWGKEYTSIDHDGYDIRHYTPLGLPDDNTRHFFANTTYSYGQTPRLLILEDEPAPTRIWDWVSKERPVIATILRNEITETPSPTSYDVRVKVCVSGMLEENCRAYSWTDTDGTTYTTYKPTGILQKYGEEDLMDFGLLTGSFQNNLEGGVLRKNISSFKNEINLNTGQFEDVSGIVDTIDKLRIVEFDGSAYQPTGWVVNRPISNDGKIVDGQTVPEAPDWGNPVSEMMYEGLRYFAGKSDPTADFVEGVTSSDTNSVDGALGLPLPAWEDPYRDGAYERCAKPIQLVISDINPSYDTDQVPGHSFEDSPSSPADAFTGDLTALDVSALADIIWTGEDEATSIFIGESNGVSDGTPSAKTVSSFKNIRGMPDEPTKMGGFYASSIAYYGLMNDLNAAEGDQKVDTFSVALASAIPRFEITVDDKIVTVVPFAKSVAHDNGSIDSTEGAFQPTDQLVDFYILTVANTHSSNMDSNINDGRPQIEFNVNFEDVEQAADHDMDAIAGYKIWLDGDGNVHVDMRKVYAAGGIHQHMGYVISGTEEDGTYLDIRDDTPAYIPDDYFLDTPPGQYHPAPIIWNDGVALPLESFRVFTPTTSASSTYIKHDPLWYAAKWGGFEDDGTGSGDPKPDNTDEWDTDGDGVPDNYFLVTNAGKFEEQLTKAFLEVVSRTSSSAAVATNSTRLDTNTKIYQARFDSDTWSGEFFAFSINTDGTIGSQAWDAATLIPSSDARNIFAFKPGYDNPAGDSPVVDNSGTGIVFEWLNLNTDQQDDLNKDASGNTDTAGESRLEYIRGDQTNEGIDAGKFRIRESLLGDVINSDPWFSGVSDDFGYIVLPGDEGSSYSTFRTDKRDRAPAVFFGANDGMLHAVNADTGDELFTYVPNEVISSLSTLTSQKYGCNGLGCLPHRYFVDGSPKVGDAYFGSTPEWHTVLVGGLGAGGKAIFALDVTNPVVADPVVADPPTTTEYTTTLPAFDESSVLWEVSINQAYNVTDKAVFTDNLGYTLPQASVVRLNNGQWAAVVANGYESAGDTAVLFLLDIQTGQIIKTINTDVGSGGSPNGLSTPITVDVNGDRIADYVYAGDLLGNMWKFDLTNSDPEQWVVAFSGSPLFTACSEDPCVTTQPITAKPQVGRHSDGGVMVYFGTGKYYEVNDQVVGDNPPIQNFYGIRDNGSTVSGLDVLQEQVILAESTLTDYNVDVRVTSDTDTNYTGNDANGDGDYIDANEFPPKEGWFMKLLSPVNGAEGERVVVVPLLRSGRVVFVSMIPESDACGWGGTSWLMELDAESGARLDNSPFDVNGDGEFTTADYVQLYDTNDDGVVDGDDDPLPISGTRKKDKGIIKTPGVVVCEDGKECKYTSGTSGNLDMISESSGSPTGRQSWNQIR